VLWATAGYGVAAITLAQGPLFLIAVLGAAGIGLFDAMHTTVRHAAVQLEVPDELRGRVTATYQIASRGGPALGDLNIGAIAAVLGPVTALSIGGVLPIVAAAGAAVKGARVRDYQVPQHQVAK